MTHTQQVDTDTFVFDDTPCDLCGAPVGDDAYTGYFMGYAALTCEADRPALHRAQPISTLSQREWIESWSA